MRQQSTRLYGWRLAGFEAKSEPESQIGSAEQEKALLHIWAGEARLNPNEPHLNDAQTRYIIRLIAAQN